MFITIEGIDGAGKSTIAKAIKNYLINKGYDVFLTCEPGGSEMCERIRQLLLDDDSDKLDWWSEALLYIASRKQHLKDVILPQIKMNKIVLCDRFFDSTVAYQGYGRGLPVAAINQIQTLVLNKFKPDYTFWIKKNPLTAVDHLDKSNKTKNRFDVLSNDFFSKVEQGYATIAKQNPERFIIIDGEQPLAEVKNQAINHIKNIINIK